jgi:hypothetical protein
MPIGQSQSRPDNSSRLRARRRDEVPSDDVRRLIMSWQIADLVEERRAEIAAMPQPTAEEVQAALAAALNEYVRAHIAGHPETVVAGRI